MRFIPVKNRLIILLCALVLGSMPPATAMAKMTPHSYLPSIRIEEPLTPTDTLKYQPNTVVIDYPTMTKLVSGDGAASEFHFQPTATAVAKLKAGQIVIFSGLALRQVSSVTVTNTEIVVQTSETTLDKAVVDGTLGWDYHVDWLQLPASTYAAMRAGPPGSELHLDSISGFGADGLPLRDAAVPPVLSFTGKVQGWDVTMKLTPTAARLNIDLTGKRVDGSAQTLVSGKGFINTFTQETFVTYEKSKLDDAVVKSIGLNGEMEVKWAAAAPDGGLTTVFLFTIPLELPIPIQIGPVPVILKVKAVFNIVPELNVDSASSGGSWKATYKSDEGLQFHNNVLTASGSAQGASLDTSGETVSAGFGPVGFGLGVEFPRLEVSIFNVVSAFITVKTYGTSIFLTEPPCQKGDLTLTALAGFSVKFFGAGVGVEPTKLWEQTVHKSKDNKDC